MKNFMSWFKVASPGLLVGFMLGVMSFLVLIIVVKIVWTM